MSITRAAVPGSNGITAIATNATYLGAATKLELATREGAKLTLSVPTETASVALNGDKNVWLSWPAEKGFLLDAQDHTNTQAVSPADRGRESQ